MLGTVLLDGRVAVVSGVGPGLGRDIALTLARAGADVVLAARRQEVLEKVASDVEALGRRALCVPTDITDADACARLAAAVDRELGRLDVLVNSAFAEEDWHGFDGLDPERWRQPFEVNLFGTMQLTQSLLPTMRRTGRGSIVMITTLSIHMVNPVLAGYAASKRALTTASQVLAAELNCVAPGHIWGEALAGYFAWQAENRGVSPQDIYDEVAAGNALNHIHTSEEVARVVLFFASDLSRGINGQTLNVSCGRVFV